MGAANIAIGNDVVVATIPKPGRMAGLCQATRCHQ
jgi:hypothetical protein